MNESICQAAADYATRASLQAVQFSEIFLCAFALVFVFLNVNQRASRSRRSVPMHRNLKILLANALIFYVMHVVTYGPMALVTQAYAIFSSNPCDNVWLSWQCLSFKIPANAALLGFTFVHFSILLERTAATFVSAYEKRDTKPAMATVAVMWFAVVALTTFIYWDERLYVSQTNCITYADATLHKRSVATFLMIIVDIIVALGDGALLWVNCKKVARAKIQVGDYSLAESYQLSENQMTIRIILPCSTVHGVLYGLYFLLSKTIREPFRRLQDERAGAVVEGIHLISTASICGVLVMFYWTQRSVTSRLKPKIVKVESVANAHFDLFKRQMDTAYREKKTWRKASVALVVSKLTS